MSANDPMLPDSFDRPVGAPACAAAKEIAGFDADIVRDHWLSVEVVASGSSFDLASEG